ncbi:tripartite tricarboxylate transporter TctB family protein [Ancylobacter sp. FA202]|uniref:tripartite tricarboxylate transporter TctB family protein n=1 Tax=Ancylobacter sp. FA202 TaxID=1111106 RepID=UPI00037FD176|nr:tripartite tricarboxylate transporter TctB family protein [Ancylobacter sp. FA202]
MEISRKTMEVATAVLTGSVGALICYGSTENGIGWGPGGPEPGYFPFGIGCLILIGSLATLVQTFWKHAGAHPAGGHSAGAGAGAVPEEPFIDGTRLRLLVAFVLPIVAMTALSAWLGLYIGMGLYIFYTMRVSAGFRTLTSLAAALLVIAVNFVVFEKLFMVPLLKGPILEYFGIY